MSSRDRSWGEGNKISCVGQLLWLHLPVYDEISIFNVYFNYVFLCIFEYFNEQLLEITNIMLFYLVFYGYYDLMSIDTILSVSNSRNRQFLDLRNFLDENGWCGLETLQFKNVNWFESKLDLQLNYSDMPFRQYSFAKICGLSNGHYLLEIHWAVNGIGEWN